IQSFLKHGTDVLDALNVAEKDAGIWRRIITGAKRLSESWPGLGPGARRSLVRSFVKRILVHSDRLVAHIAKSQLQRAILNGEPIKGQTHNDGDAIPEERPYCLDIEVRWKRCGGEVRFLVDPSSRDDDSAQRRVMPSLVKAVARAYLWSQRLLDGQSV